MLTIHHWTFDLCSPLAQILSLAEGLQDASEVVGYVGAGTTKKSSYQVALEQYKYYANVSGGIDRMQKGGSIDS